MERDPESRRRGQCARQPGDESQRALSADEARIAMLRDRIDAARRRLRDEVDTIRGE